jgi:proteasome lid subunit RPN8/RPN11
MKITLTQAAYRTILDHAREWYPMEACGLIAGRLNAHGKEITQVLTLPNTALSRERFTIDPKEQLAAIKAIRAEGLLPLGNFHSHPETPARPSEEDLKLYLDPKASYLILSLAERRPILKSFALITQNDQKTSVEEPLELI